MPGPARARVRLQPRRRGIHGRRAGVRRRATSLCGGGWCGAGHDPSGSAPRRGWCVESSERPCTVPAAVFPSLQWLA